MKKLITDLQHSVSQAPEHRHSHLSCEMVYVKREKARFTIGGVDYTAGPGCLLFISSLEEHQVRVLSEPYERYFAILSLAELTRAFPHSSLTAVFTSRPRGFTHCVPLRSSRTDADAIFASLHREYLSDLPCAREMAEAELKRLLVLTRRACPENFAACPGPVAGRVREAQEYIDRHFTQELSVAQVAAKFFVSPSHLTHSFHEQVGYSPKQYIKLLRLSYARELMETTDLPVTDVAVKCGFADVNNFIRAFRQTYSVPPGKWRHST